MEIKTEFIDIISKMTILSSFSNILLDMLESQDIDDSKICDLVSLAMVIQRLVNEQKYRISEIKNYLCED